MFPLRIDLVCKYRIMVKSHFDRWELMFLVRINSHYRPKLDRTLHDRQTKIEEKIEFWAKHFTNDTMDMSTNRKQCLDLFHEWLLQLHPLPLKRIRCQCSRLANVNTNQANHFPVIH